MAQQQIVSGVGLGSTPFPTLFTAWQQVQQQLQRLYGPMGSMTKAGPFAGSFNTVDIYTINFGGIAAQNILPTTKKIAVRKGKEASFALLHTGVYSPAGGPVAASHLRTATYAQHTASALKHEALQSQNNWVFAHEHNLSPELYFYGYVKMSSNANMHRLYLCAISEAFDSDLLDFYSKDYRTEDGATQASIDIMVRKQLTNLFNELARMGMLCFDIKPRNTVINYKEYILSKGVKPLTVKLIDWDADWCLKQAGLAKGRRLGTEQLRIYYGLLMQIVMAIFFYGYFNNNIFADYFRKTLHSGDSRVDANVYSSLGLLFCQSKNDIYFQHMASHYFARPGFAAPSGIPYGGNCSMLWRGIYRRIFYKNRTAFSAARNAAAIDNNDLSKYLFAGGLALLPVSESKTSGGKRKHKKRRKRRNSKRHRRTRRKRRSMRRKTKRSRRKHRTQRRRRRRH